jgi:hypothetical protein
LVMNHKFIYWWDMKPIHSFFWDIVLIVSCHFWDVKLICPCNLRAKNMWFGFVAYENHVPHMSVHVPQVRLSCSWSEIEWCNERWS